MRKALIIYEEKVESIYGGICEIIERIFNEEQFEVERICIKSNILMNDYSVKLVKSRASYICTLDMAGFQLDTLLNMPIYNILTAKQIHIIIDEKIFPVYAENEFALNLFLYLPGNAEKWRNKYPHILGMESYEKLEMDEEGNIKSSEANENIIGNIIDRVIYESEKNC